MLWALELWGYSNKETKALFPNTVYYSLLSTVYVYLVNKGKFRDKQYLGEKGCNLQMWFQFSVLSLCYGVAHYRADNPNQDSLSLLLTFNMTGLWNHLSSCISLRIAIIFVALINKVRSFCYILLNMNSLQVHIRFHSGQK